MRLSNGIIKIEKIEFYKERDCMQVMMFMSIFWILYGIAGLFGIQHIPAKYKGYSWTKKYIRHQGISWLMIGVPWFVLYLIYTFCTAYQNISDIIIILIAIMLAIPSIIYTIIWTIKFDNLLSKEQKTNKFEFDKGV